ncbi:MAG: response regulator transcription factor [Anaerolineales bacterium]|nr:MAG: response regulator transcription factor [Anaerolineales bacterium]
MSYSFQEKIVPKAKILVIDDEPSITKLVSAYLQPEGYEVYTAADGEAGLKAARAFQPDLIVLDIMLPGLDGIELLTRLRRESDVYVILLTAKTEETDKIVGLSVGADDYVTKPFSPRELVARIKAALRRLQSGSGQGSGSTLAFQQVRIDIERHQAWVNEEEIELTAMEFDLLRALAENHGRVLSREQLLEKVWGHEYFGEIRVVDVHIGHIRQKLGDENLIATVRGVGYRFQDEVL